MSSSGPPPRRAPVRPILVALYVWGLRRRRPAGVRYSSLRSSLPRGAPGSRALRRHLPVRAPVRSRSRRWRSRPAVRSRSSACPPNETTIVLAIDVSGSMCSTDIAPTRIQAAEAAAAAFVEEQGLRPRSGSSPSAASPRSSRRRRTDQAALLDSLGRPDHGPPDGDRQRDPRRDRRNRRDRLERSRRARPTRPSPPRSRRSRRATTHRRSSWSSPTGPATRDRTRSTRPRKPPIAGSASTRSVMAPPRAGSSPRSAPPSSSATSQTAGGGFGGGGFGGGGGGGQAAGSVA